MTELASNELIKKLKELAGASSVSSYSHIKNILSNQRLQIVFTKYNPGVLIRCRPNISETELFEKVDDLSYRKDILNINNFGRVNEPGQPIFYCNDRENENTGITESLSLFRGNEKSEIEVFTTGAWKVSEALNLAVIVSTQSNHGKNAFLDEMKRIYEGAGEGEYFSDLLNFNEFLCNEFSKDLIKDKSNYLITCAYSNYIKSTYSDNVDGIVYGSVKSEGEGINIALWPETVDKKLELVAARKRILKRFPNKVFGEIALQDSKSIDSSSGQIHWKDLFHTGFSP